MGTYVDALHVLQAFLKDGEDGVGLEIDDEVWTAGEDAEGTFAETWLCGLGHVERLCLQGMPRAAARHGVVGKVAYGVDGFPAHGIGGFMGERVKEETLESGQGLRGELIVEGRSRFLLLLIGCGTKEDAAKEDQGKGSHLHLTEESAT